MNDKAKKQRKCNFSKAEEVALLEEFLRNKYVLLAKFKSGLTNRDKKAAWAEVVCAVNAVGNASRSIADCKGKWQRLATDGKKHIHEAKHPKTGGGPPNPAPWFVDVVLEILGSDSTLISGVAGGIDSGDKENKENESIHDTHEHEDNPNQDDIDDASIIYATTDEDGIINLMPQNDIRRSMNSFNLPSTSANSINYLPAVSCVSTKITSLSSSVSLNSSACSTTSASSNDYLKSTINHPASTSCCSGSFHSATKRRNTSKTDDLHDEFMRANIAVQVLKQEKLKLEIGLLKKQIREDECSFKD